MGFSSSMSPFFEEEAAKDCRQDTQRDRIQTEGNALFVYIAQRTIVTKREKCMVVE
jgi:hypothetical protein